MKRSTLLPALTALALLTAAAPHALASYSVVSEVTNIQTRANTDITARLTSLSNLTSKVSAATHLTAAQKTALQTDLAGQSTGLQSLKATISADTTAAVAKTDFQTIFTAHYIYAFYLPRTDRVVVADAQVDAATKLTAVATTLQTYIDQAKAKGNDVTAVQAQLTDMQAKTTAALTPSQAALTSLVALTAAGYPSNKPTIQSAASSLATARTNLQAAKTDATAIVTSLKAMFPSPAATK